MASSVLRLKYHTQRRNSRYDSSERVISSSHWHLPDNTQQIFMPPPGFELTISTGERPQPYAIDHAAKIIDLWIPLRSRFMKGNRVNSLDEAWTSILYTNQRKALHV
jgi:hypothetical protein